MKKTKTKNVGLTSLRNNLEKLLGDVEETSIDHYDYNKDELKGIYLLGEGYDHITYPGTAHVRQYRLFKDGILKISIFMDEESSHIESTMLYTIPQFLNYLKHQYKESLPQFHQYINKIRKKINKQNDNETRIN
ncbi:MAG: hypothetical protein AABW90_03065 [Nanoarchaeota archaeon]